MEHKNYSTMVGVVAFVIVAVVAGIMSFINRGPDQTPSQVVQSWIEVYPTEMTKAATLTTNAMREGLTPDDWARQGQKSLGAFRYVSGEVVSENVDGNQAEVLVDAEINSPLGKQLQKEQFRLTLVDNNWAIDERAVVMVLPAPPPFFD